MISHRFAFRFASRCQSHLVSPSLQTIVAGNFNSKRIPNECRSGLNSLPSNSDDASIIERVECQRIWKQF